MNNTKNTRISMALAAMALGVASCRSPIPVTATARDPLATISLPMFSPTPTRTATGTPTNQPTATLTATLTATPTQTPIPDYIWKPIGPYGGKIDALAISPSTPNLLFAAGGMDSDRLYKTADGGNNWEFSNHSLLQNPIGRIAVDPINPEIVYAKTHEGIIKSEDGGQTWRTINDGMPTDLDITLRFDTLVIDPVTPTKVYVGTGNIIFKSTNAGESWTAIMNPKGFGYVFVLVIDPSNPKTLYAGTETGLWKSEDEGANWRSIAKEGSDLSAPPAPHGQSSQEIS